MGSPPNSAAYIQNFTVLCLATANEHKFIKKNDCSPYPTLLFICQ